MASGVYQQWKWVSFWTFHTRLRKYPGIRPGSPMRARAGYVYPADLPLLGETLRRGFTESA